MKTNLTPYDYSQNYPGIYPNAVSWKRLYDHEAAQLGSQPIRITCLTGRIWLTQENEYDDVVLEGGETCQLSSPGLVVAQGLPSALLKISRL